MKSVFSLFSSYTDHKITEKVIQLTALLCQAVVVSIPFQIFTKRNNLVYNCLVWSPNYRMLGFQLFSLCRPKSIKQNSLMNDSKTIRFSHWWLFNLWKVKNLEWLIRFHNCLVYLRNFKSRIFSCASLSQYQELRIFFQSDFKNFVFNSFENTLQWLTCDHNCLVYF